MSAPATPADLAWWLDLAPTLRWTWAKTYSDTAPHWYVVQGRSGPEMDRDDFLRVGRIIRTFGEPGRFYAMTNLYLYTADRAHKFWCMWSDPPLDGDATLVNLARTDRVYGPQRDFDQGRLRDLVLPADRRPQRGSSKPAT